MPIRPRRLQPGDTIGIAAPASPPPDPNNIDRGVAALEAMGFKVRLAPNVRKRWGFLAGSDRERADDLMRLFADRKVNAILCVRGGYGAARLLPLLDFEFIRRHPKIFVGYSDITSLHCALLRRANLISFHGPMLNSDFAHARVPRFTRESFLRTLCGVDAAGRPWCGDIAEGYTGRTVAALHPGVARGRLVGGNLTLLCASLGTPWQPPFRGCILFFEDVNEKPYGVDRMLTQLLNAGLLQQVAGVAVGIHQNCRDPKAARSREYRQTVDDVIRERLLPLGVPLVTGLPFGHLPTNATLPVGAEVELDADRGRLRLLEPAVR
jgi:muramoyltetrapeptide carboxypeptidase